MSEPHTAPGLSLFWGADLLVFCALLPRRADGRRPAFTSGFGAKEIKGEDAELVNKHLWIVDESQA